MLCRLFFFSFGLFLSLWLTGYDWHRFTSRRGLRRLLLLHRGRHCLCKCIIIIFDTLRQEEINSVFFIPVASDERSNHRLFGETHTTDTVNCFHLCWTDSDLLLVTSSRASHARLTTTHTGTSSCSWVISSSSLLHNLKEGLRILCDPGVDIWSCLLHGCHKFLCTLGTT